MIVGIAALAEELAFAVSHADIRAYVQPVCDLESDELVGYQGLARWQHRARGLLEASAFIEEGLQADARAPAVIEPSSRQISPLRRRPASVARGEP